MIVTTAVTGFALFGFLPFGVDWLASAKRMMKS